MAVAPTDANGVKVVKVIRHEKHKGGCRVEFLCGRRALLDMDKKNSTLLKVAQSLSTKPELVPEHIEKLKADMQTQLEAVKSKLLAMKEKQLEEIMAVAPTDANGVKVVAWPLDGFDAKDIKAFIPKLTAHENTLGLLVAAKPERISYAAVAGANTSIDCRAVMKELNAAFAGRGGGKSDCAQGGSDYCADWEAKLAAVVEKLVQ